VREEAQGDIGLLRYRLMLHNGDLLEMFERFRIVQGRLQVDKYSFHLQDSNGKLRKRWDNAAHHPEVATRPHHVHEGREEIVKGHTAITSEEVLSEIALEMEHDSK